MAATDGLYRRPPHTDFGTHDADHLPISSVILDTMVYLDARTNATTAGGVTSTGVAVMVTLWAADPPRISYFTVRFPGSALPDGNPRVLRTDGDLVLFRFLVGPEGRSMYPQYNDYVVYQAGVNKLRVLPSHPTRLFSDMGVGLLCCRRHAAAADEDRFLLASIRWTYARGHYALDLFDSMPWAWSTRSMHVESPEDFCFTVPDKVINLHGSSIGWVNLWNGILIFDSLRGDDNDTLQFIRLPMPPPVPNKLARRAMACTRDVSFSDGCLRFADVWAHAVPGSDDGLNYISQDWGAAVMKRFGHEKKWQVDCMLKASEITMETSLSRLLHGLPHRHEATQTEYTLSRLHVGHPALSLHDDDVVYIMAKVDQMDNNGWMLALDMRNKTIKGVADFNARRSIVFMYFTSDVSRHASGQKVLHCSG